jgi:hypothetical protein
LPTDRELIQPGFKSLSKVGPHLPDHFVPGHSKSRNGRNRLLTAMSDPVDST